MEHETLICPCVFVLLKDSAIINEDNLPMFHRCGIMALVAAYLNFVSQMIAVPAFCQHVSKVIYLDKSLHLNCMRMADFLPVIIIFNVDDYVSNY